MSERSLWREQLEVHLPIDVDRRDDATERLLVYLALLDKWNRAFNLTGVRARAEWVPRHILDSLALLPWIDRGPLLDVGSGAGLPGIPLAIARPDLQLTLVDSNGKKTRFLQQVRTEAGLDNVAVRRVRIEQLRAPSFPIITGRAFAALADFIAASRHLLASDGCWLAMKSAHIETEINDLPDDVAFERHPVEVPLLDAKRQIVRLWCRSADRAL